jgi:hypothetical protein
MEVPPRPPLMTIQFEWAPADAIKFFDGHGFSLWGFRGGNASLGSGRNSLWIGCPGWLPLLISGVVSRWVWRKTRRRELMTPFPVEVKETAKVSS